MIADFSNFGILMIGRLLGGIATSLLFSVFEAWLIRAHADANIKHVSRPANVQPIMNPHECKSDAWEIFLVVVVREFSDCHRCWTIGRKGIETIRDDRNPGRLNIRWRVSQSIRYFPRSIDSLWHICYAALGRELRRGPRFSNWGG